MKILFASDCYRFQTGGITTVITTLEKGLRARGHEVKVLALSDGFRSFKDGDSVFIGGYKYIFVPEQRRSFARHTKPLRELAAWKPDIIHAHTEASTANMARVIARATGAPLVMTSHTDFAYYIFGPRKDSRIVRSLFNLWGKYAYRGLKDIIVPSEKSRSFSHLQPVADRLTVIPNGIDPAPYRQPLAPEEKAALFRRCGLKETGFTLVTVSRMRWEKNVMELIRFMPALRKKVPEAQLLLVGEGENRKEMEAWCEAHGLSDCTCFTGRVPPEEVWRYLAMSDIYVSASVFEVHSMSWLEALAAGLPLVCREDSALIGVLENGENGFLYHNEQEYTEAVSKIAGDPALREAMHEKALLFSGKFTEDRFTENTLAFYESILKKG